MEGKAGEDGGLERAAAVPGGALKPVVGIYAADQSLLREFEERRPFSYRFEKAGTYYIRVGDYDESGSGGHFYRIKVGKLPVAISAYPLGLQRGKTAEITLTGYNLPAKLQLKGDPSPDDDRAVIVRP